MRGRGKVEYEGRKGGNKEEIEAEEFKRYRIRG